MPEQMCHCDKPQDHACPCVIGTGVATYKAEKDGEPVLVPVKMEWLCDGTGRVRE